MPFALEQVHVPQAEVHGADHGHVAVDNAEGGLQGPLGVLVAVGLPVGAGNGLEELPDELLGGPLGDVLADVERIVGLHEGIPVLVAYAVHVLAAAGLELLVHPALAGLLLGGQLLRCAVAVHGGVDVG